MSGRETQLECVDELPCCVRLTQCACWVYPKQATFEVDSDSRLDDVGLKNDRILTIAGIGSPHHSTLG